MGLWPGSFWLLLGLYGNTVRLVRLGDDVARRDSHRVRFLRMEKA